MTDSASLPRPASADLSGQVALVTGTTSGLGVRFARVLAGAGAAVVLTGRRPDRLVALESEIRNGGGQAVCVTLDVTDAQSIRTALAQAEDRLGPVDILVNNAGMNVQAPAADLSPEAYDRIMNTNVRGAFLMAQAVGAGLIARGAPGRIVNIASIGAFTVLPGLTAYCMSKAAVAMMTKSLAREWARHGINVNALCPGYIRTEINSDWFDSEGGQKQIRRFPRRRLGAEEDLDGALLLLVSPDAGFITGTVMTVDDGQSLAGG
ncbi:MAG: glucose 1-dehydrogenase [Alphaproteobacteria bacterium]